MGMEKYINAIIDKKQKPAGTAGPVDAVTVAAMARHADESRAAARDAGRRGGCITDNEMAAFIEHKKEYPGYDRVIRHMADCADCRRRAFDLSRLARSVAAAKKIRPPSDVIDRAFAGARSMTAGRTSAPGRRMLVPLAAAAAVAIALSGLLYQALQPKPGAAYITFYAGSVRLVHDGKPAAAAVKLALSDADTITTGANSLVLLQIDEAIVVKITENSSVTMKSIQDRKKRELFTARGTVLSRVEKLAGDSAYRVATPTIVAAVKGTEFSVRYAPGTAVVAVRRGEVGVSSARKGKETPVPAGTTGVFAGREKQRKISVPESHELEAISDIPVVRGMGAKSEAELRDLMEPFAGKTTGAGTSLERMKAQYGHIHTVSLYSGKVIEGVILSRGTKYIILTPKGKISIPERQIRATRARYVRNSSK